MLKRISLFAFLLLGILISIISIPRMIWAIISNSPRAINIALAYDQLGNAVFNGIQRETISSRAGRARLLKRRWGCVLCRLLDWAFAPYHCEKSIISEYLDVGEREVYDKHFKS